VPLDAVLHSLRTRDGVPTVGVRTRAQFLEGLAEEKTEFLERVWNPTVLVDGGVAVVWAPYDFHAEGQFSHCGIDVLTLVESGEGWRITGVTYNVVTESCEPSPLGTPAFNQR
jgi:hypothetical protein